MPLAANPLYIAIALHTKQDLQKIGQLRVARLVFAYRFSVGVRRLGLGLGLG